jgi:hypothetical protein
MVDPRHEPLSPELALVDPALAAAVRASLPAEPWKAFLPELAPVPAVATVPAPAAVSAPDVEAPLRWPDEPEPQPVAPRRRRSRRLVLTAAFVAAAAAGVLVGGDFIAPRAADRPTFATASGAAGTTGTMTAQAQPSPTVRRPVAPAAFPATTAHAPKTKPKPKPKPSVKRKPATPRPRPAKPSIDGFAPKTSPAFVPARVFAWGPVKGATSYRVRFYHGRRLVLKRTTKSARIELPRGFAFAKGRYRWVVEAKTGATYGNAVVDSKFTIR